MRCKLANDYTDRKNECFHLKVDPQNNTALASVTVDSTIFFGAANFFDERLKMNDKQNEAASTLLSQKKNVR